MLRRPALERLLGGPSGCWEAGLPGTLAQKLDRLAVPCGVVTLGARGCCAHQGGRWWLQPGFAVNALDTTAAGDTFCGTLTAALSRHESLAGALRQACNDRCSW